MYAIYTLIDPRNEQVRYVGMTKDVYARFAQHVACDGSNPRKDAWIQELKALNLLLSMKVVERSDTAERARKREHYWIEHYQYLGIQNDLPLLNQIMMMYQREIPPELAYQAKVNRVRLLREQGLNQSKIIKLVWGCAPGDSDVYRQARDEFKTIMAQIVLEDDGGQAEEG